MWAVIELALARSEKTWVYKDVKMVEFGQNCPTTYVKLARVFQQPSLIRAAIRGLGYTPRLCMGVDGSFVQGTGYGQIHLKHMRLMRGCNGYSDPDWFAVPEGEPSYGASFRYPTGEHEAFWMKAYNWLARIRMPDGGVPVTNDGEHSGYMPWIPGINVPLKRSGDSVAPGFKYAQLGDGSGDEQIQLHLNYSSNCVNHGHADTLTLHLFAFGHYLLDDSEYCKTNIRAYAGSTAGHNTVTVDHTSQNNVSGVLPSIDTLPFNEGMP